MSSHTTDFSKEVDVLIIGAGISGLSTAWWLAQSGLSVQVWEKALTVGGKIKTTPKDGFLTEQSASMVMNFKPEVDHFFKQSNIDKFKAQRLLASNSKRYLIHKGQLHALPMTISKLFFSSLWSTSGKFRLLMEPFVSSYKESTKGDESVADFITRRLGSEFLEKAMEPFIAGTLASNPNYACASEVIPRLTALEKKYGSITAGIFAHKLLGKRTARNPEAFSFKGGMQTLVDQLASHPDFDLQTDRRVVKIIQHHAKETYPWEIHAQSGRREIQCRAKHIVISSPASAAAQLIKPLNQKLSNLLASIEYASLSVVHIGLQRSAVKHPLDSVGFLVPRLEKIQHNKVKINGNLWMSSVFSDRAPKDHVLLSSYIGGAYQPQAINLSTQESVDQVLDDISPLLGINKLASPVMVRVDKHKQALPLYYGQYKQKLEAINQQLQKLPTLHLQGNYKGGVSVRDRIVQGKKIAQLITQKLLDCQKKKLKHDSQSSKLEGFRQDIFASSMTTVCSQK